MFRAHAQVKSTKAVVTNGQQLQDATQYERLAREDLWADLAGEEIDEDVSFNLEVFDDLFADTHDFND